MQKSNKDLQGYKIWIILASVFLVLLFDHLGFFEETNQHLYDLSFRLRGSRPPIKDILLIAIHEGTLKKLGRWPIQRLYYSSLLERLKEAEVVVFDITLSEPTGDDSLLAQSIKSHGRVILPVHIDNQMSLSSPAPTLRTFHRAGHVHLEEGIDGIVRDVYHTLFHQKRGIPSISSVAYEMVSRTSFQRTSPLLSDKSDKDILQIDRMRINYCGPPGTFETIFLSDVLDDVYPPAFFRGKIVLVGVAAIGLGDQFLTPFSQNRNYMPGIEVQANILNTLLMNDSIQVISPWILWPFILLLSLLSYLLFLKVPEGKAALLGLAFLMGMTTIFYILFSTWNLWVTPVFFYVAILAVFLVTYVMKLECAAKNLDRACAEMLPQLRWKEKAGEGQEGGQGVSGILTPGGIQSKARILGNVSHQLIFEKKLTDKALLSHLHAVLLFGPDGKNVIINETAVAYCEANSLDRTTAERFLKAMGPYLLEKRSLGIDDLQQGYVTCIISLPLPERRYIKIDAAPIDGPDGKYLLFILSDVTQVKELEVLKEHLMLQKRAEEALRKSEERFRELYDHAPVGYHEFDLEGCLTRVNRTELEMLGYTQDEMIGQPIWKFNVEDEVARKRVLAKLAGEMPESKGYELTYRRKDGTALSLLAEDRLILDPEGRITGMRGIIQDITERKRAEEALRDSEERYRSLVENSTDMIFIVQDELIKFSNPATIATLGYSEEEFAALPFVDRIHPEDRAMVAEKYEKGFQGEEVPNTYSFRILNKWGDELWVQLNAVLITWEGRPGVLCFLRDVTSQKRLETQYHQAQKMEAIGTLAGGIAHDFNNILSAIMGYAELASLDIKEGTKARYDLEHSIRAAQRAKDLVQQILAFSRQGRQERRPLNIKPIVKEGLKFLRASLPATIEIQQEIEEDLGTIEADPTQIHQVLLNLCTNAAHAMEEKGGVLEVSLSNSDVEDTSARSGEIGPGAYVRLRVSDTGQGMPPEILNKIFDPYFTTKEAGKGTGLGLAVVHGIVKSYGGGVTVSSEVGRGSTFDIYFPRVEAVGLPSEGYKAEPLPVGFHERVLFVDDEGEIVEVGREILEYLGYEVVAKTSSKEALELFRGHADWFDLVITDMTMPNMTGDKLAQELLKIRPGIPIILCTGFSEHITAEKAKGMGIRELAMKPLVMKELAKAMRRALDTGRDRGTESMDSKENL